MSSGTAASLESLASGNFAGLLRSAGASFGNRVAIEADGTSTSFAELAARAESVAAALAEAGFQPGDRAGILLPRGAEAAAAFFGVLWAGGIAVLVNELYQVRQVEHVLRHAGAKLLIASPDLLGGFPQAPDFGGQILAPTAIRKGLAAAVVRSVGDPAQLVYTSGSTGQPKGVLVGHGNLWAGALTVARYLGIRQDDRIASVLPFGFVYGFNQLACSLVAGATLSVERALLAQDLATSLAEHQISVLAGVPPLWLQLLGAPAFTEAPLPRLRVLTCAGGRLPRSPPRRCGPRSPRPTCS